MFSSGNRKCTIEFFPRLSGGYLDPFGMLGQGLFHEPTPGSPLKGKHKDSDYFHSNRNLETGSDAFFSGFHRFFPQLVFLLVVV